MTTHKAYLEKSEGDAGLAPVDIPIQLNSRKKVVLSERLQPYFPDPELVRAVNVALLINRPLLVMGEPGCGKSLLAKDIAFCWYGDQMLLKNKYFEWPIKSTSKAKEGLYEFDHLRRLHAANTKAPEAKDPANFVRLGQLANAMKATTADEKAVLLIDEIDKADIDFSNDLLNELDQNSFTITETGEKITSAHKPFIVITSNSEKDLSDAFLRRCVFHYIDLFSNKKISTEEPKKWLKRIIKARYYNGEESTDPMIGKAIEAFISFRKRMNTDMLSFRKTISTSEFLDWFSVLKQCAEGHGTPALRSDLNAWIENNNHSRIPFGNALFKTKSLLDLQTQP
jgi:MoxR-like ATPase